MEIRWPDDAAFQQLARSIAPLVAPALRRLGQRLAPTIEIVPADDVPDLWLPEADGRIRLDGRLAAGPPHRPAQADLFDQGLGALALDRWRETVGAVLEAGLWAADAAEDAGAGVPRGSLADQVDRAAPELGWHWAPALRLLRHPTRGTDPQQRSWMWWLRWCRETEQDPLDQSGPTLLAFWRWVRAGPRGLAGRLPVHVSASPPVPGASIPAFLPPRGAVAVAGPAAFQLDGPLHPKTLRLGRDQAPVLVVATAPTPVNARPLGNGPVGTWSLDSGSAGAQIGSARGVSLELRAGGIAELVAADAWLGLVAGPSLDDAARHGVSGAATGRWELAQVADSGRTGTLRVFDLHRGSATLHNRGGGGFAVPDGPRVQAVRAFLQALSGTTAEWVLDGQDGLELRLRAPWPLVLRFSREAGTSGGSPVVSH